MQALPEDAPDMPEDGEMTTYMMVNISRNDKASLFRYYAPELPSSPCYFL